MDKGNQELSLILKKIAQNLILGAFQELKDIGNQLPQSIGEPILTITNLYQNNIEQSDRLQNDVFFYRDLIKAINKGNLSVEIIDNRYDIVEEKRNQALSLLMRFKQLEKMRINHQVEVSQKEIQAEKAHSSSKIILEKDFMETKSKMTKQLTTYEEEITTLKHMIQSQAEMIKDSLENGEAIQQKMKQKESENRQLNAQLRIFQKQISQLQRRFRSINTDLQQSKILQTQATIESRILCKQIEQKQQKITFMKNLQDQYKSVISNRQEENRSLRLDMAELKSQMEEIKESKQVRRKSNKDLFIDKNSIIQMVKKDQKIADCFHQTLLAKVGQVGAMSSLYNYSLHKGQNFHKRVDNKKNTLLLCLTKDKRILGGFSSSGFSLKKEDRNTKAFLFSFCADTMKVFDLKRGKSSTLYDRDFLIFGNEELCIEKGSNKLTSRFVNAAASALHYQFDEYEEKQSFLSIKQKGCQSVDLQNFEILELSIKSD